MHRWVALAGIVAVGAGCASRSKLKFPEPPPGHYDNMGPLVVEERKYLGANIGWTYPIPLKPGESVIVDVMCHDVDRMDVFLVDDAGYEEYAKMLAEGHGSTMTISLRKSVNHYTQRVDRDDERNWYVVVDNTRFPTGGALSRYGILARLRIYQVPAATKQAERQQACDAGNGSVCTDIGYDYFDGNGVAKDEVMSADYFEKACNAGDARGCSALGLAYSGGRGRERDYPRAVELASRACGMGYGNGCAQVGLYYEEGSGVPADPARAAEYYQRACDADSAVGCYWLSQVLQPTDPVRAGEARGKACKLGKKEACAN